MIAAAPCVEAAQSATYLYPLATRIRALFKMDFAEAPYVSELRSAPPGHFSYRRVAWEMYLKLQRQYPTLAEHMRVTDFTHPIDIFPALSGRAHSPPSGQAANRCMVLPPRCLLHSESGQLERARRTRCPRDRDRVLA